MPKKDEIVEAAAKRWNLRNTPTQGYVDRFGGIKIGYGGPSFNTERARQLHFWNQKR